MQPADSQLISARAYARRRGVDPKTVRQAITEGRCPAQRGAGGEWLIDPERADAAWRDRTHPGHGGKREKGKMAVPGSGLVIDPAPPMPPPASEDEGVAAFMESTTRLQHYKAQITELKFLVETGELVNKAEYDRDLFKTHRSFRDRLLNIPDRVSALLAAETNPDAVQATLAREIERVLQTLETEDRPSFNDAKGLFPQFLE